MANLILPNFVTEKQCCLLLLTIRQSDTLNGNNVYRKNKLISLSLSTKCRTIALISTFLLPLTSGAADDTLRIRAIVDSAVLPVLAEYAVPGMAIGVTVNGQPFIFNYGVASKEKNTPVSDSTLFEIGSVSKTFTATLASYASVLGKLSFDDHPSKYMQELKGTAIDQASLANLGTYTAGGLPLQFPEEISNAGMIEYFQKWKPSAPVGTQRKYSNPSIGLLGHITALALKRDFAETMETQIFPQLGLKHSYIRIPESEMANYAWGYNQKNQPIRVNPGVFGAEAYGVKTTASDLIHFVQVNMDPSRLELKMKLAVDGTHAGWFEIGEMVQGLGWEQYSYPITLERLLAGNSETMIFESNAAQRLSPPRVPSTPTLFDKTGSTDGFGAYVLFVPEKNVGIVMLANRNYPISARVKIAHAILERLILLSRSN